MKPWNPTAVKFCPFCGEYSLTYLWEYNMYRCHIYNALIPAEDMP